MTEDIEALRAERDALRSELEAVRARHDAATRVWTVGELARMRHADYLANEGAILAALREGRVRSDPDPDPDRGAPAPA